MAKNLVIVESPAKAKTIEKYLGNDFIVKSSVGHIRDLAKKGMGVDTENNFEPHYEIQEDKKAIVAELKKLAKEAETVWLATDEDREGEAISWHLLEALGLKENKTKRVVYNEITKEAILKAINNPRKIDRNLVDAQQARRILDRLVGFELSPVLWKKVKPSLSAGRVQSVAVRLIVEREREVQNFVSKSSFKILANFDIEGKSVLSSSLPKNIDSELEAEMFLKTCSESTYKVVDLQKKPGKRTPTPPFTTSTLQQEAARKLGYSVSQIMSIAQRLYEQGSITYMRTDSVNLSDFAIKGISDLIVNDFGKEYLNVKRYKTKSEGAQEAHEAIRPTNFNIREVDGDNQAQRLYDLIWKRAIASQMSDAIFERTTIDISISKAKEILEAKGEVLKFDGFLKLYMESRDDEEEEETSGLLPELSIGQSLVLTDMSARERFTQSPARYTEASLVKKLEDNGIGRPSTYAPTISTILKREYVVKEDRDGVERSFKVITLENGEINKFTKLENHGYEKAKLFPTDIGILVNDFLSQHFKAIMDYQFTAKVEAEFDEIAQGRVEWKKMLKGFYTTFHSSVEDTLENSEKVTGERLLGVHPISGKNVYVRMGRYGAMAQIGETQQGDLDEKPKYTSLRKGQSINEVSLDDVLELFKLPRNLGEWNGKNIKVAVGRFGPYVQYDKLFASIPKGEDPLEVSFDRAVEIVEAKLEADKNKFINVFEVGKDTIEILNGRFGPYIKKGKLNFKIPKDIEPSSLMLDDVIKIIEDANDPKAIKKKAVSKRKK
jgi:DNA topoisomerase-1